MKRSILCSVLALFLMIFIKMDAQAEEPYSVIFRNGGSVTAIHHVFEGQMLKIYLLNPADGILSVDKSLIEKPSYGTGMSKRHKSSAHKLKRKKSSKSK